MAPRVGNATMTTIFAKTPNGLAISSTVLGLVPSSPFTSNCLLFVGTGHTPASSGTQFNREH
jgi:hypothetical protein